jgi:hypothetical protein
MARCRDYFDGRPSAPDGLSEPQAVHRTRHFDIGENHGDVELGLKQEDRGYGLVPYDGRSSGTSSWMASPFGSFEDTVMRPSS